MKNIWNGFIYDSEHNITLTFFFAKKKQWPNYKKKLGLWAFEHIIESNSWEIKTCRLMGTMQAFDPTIQNVSKFSMFQTV